MNEALEQVVELFLAKDWNSRATKRMMPCARGFRATTATPLGCGGRKHLPPNAKKREAVTVSSPHGMGYPPIASGQCGAVGLQGWAQIWPSSAQR